MVCKPYIRNKDGMAFRCYNHDCNGYSKYHSIRVESVLNEFSAPLSSIIKVCCKCFNNHTQVQIMTEVNLNKKVVMKIIDRLRTFCCLNVAENPVKLGGDGIVVQIDESLFRHKQKYHRGRQPGCEIWVFGLADVSFTPAKISLYVVDDHKASTLLPIIERVCLPGTIINSDEWRAYMGISDKLGFTYETVNHSESFVNPVTGIHTQNIESTWNTCKYNIKMHKGILGVKLDELLCELCGSTILGKEWAW
ncbi:hypothetical protein ECANGB1_978 [Enterospora canceri]|uniref:ISXO2-like transposase domain-containing protein n=1 Tax=Enterospora canceri TaxID=1081671 RepID=A0A1Y1S461_9MICR|nr:hypothetical protein ECANGB1_978 [Enterospora canceri]